jgi:streptogramin lyase
MSSNDRVGTELAGYRIEAILGRGGMSVVYLAQHGRLQRKVALKILSPELSQDEAFRERFVRESRLAASLEHPNIVPIYDADETDGVLYIAMRYVQGTDLRGLLRQRGRLDPRETVFILGQVASALDAAHARDLVHRDVKPANILISFGSQPGSPEHVYLSDFGLTRRTSSESALTEAGQFVGTLDYAAPEQFEGKQVDGRADIYSLGCVLFECLAGEPPFKRDQDVAVMYAHMSGDIPRLSERRPELPPALDGVIEKALAKRPEDRYVTAGAAIGAVRTEVGDTTAAPTTGQPGLPAGSLSAKSDRRRRLFVVGAVLLVLALIAGAVVVAARGHPLAQGDRVPTSPASPPVVAVPTAGPAVVMIDPFNRIGRSVSLGSSANAVAAGGGAVWVTDPVRGVVTRIDPTTGQTVASVPVGGGLAGVAIGPDAVWVTTKSAGTVVRIDPLTNSVVATIRVGAGIDRVAVGQGVVWVVNSASGSIAQIDPVQNVLTQTIRLDHVIDVAVGDGGTWALTFRFTVDTDGKSDLYKLDLERGRAQFFTGVFDTSGVFGLAPCRLAVADGAAWITASFANQLYRIDLSTGALIKIIPTGPRPVAVAADGAGNVWVVNRTDGSVWKISSSANSTAASVSVGQSPTDAAVGEGGVWVTVDVSLNQTP